MLTSVDNFLSFLEFEGIGTLLSSGIRIVVTVAQEEYLLASPTII